MFKVAESTQACISLTLKSAVSTVYKNVEYNKYDTDKLPDTKYI
jgi:hypothetical protein